MQKDKVIIGDNLRYIRKKNNLSQKSVAEALHIDRTAYTYYESGRSNPNYRNLLNLCKIFHVTPNFFFTPLPKDGLLPLGDSINPDDFIYSEFKSKDEQMLLMNFRLLSDEDKRKVLELVNKLGDQGLK